MCKDILYIIYILELDTYYINLYPHEWAAAVMASRQ